MRPAGLMARFRRAVLLAYDGYDIGLTVEFCSTAVDGTVGQDKSRLLSL